jgi:hypothetical protein
MKSRVKYGVKVRSRESSRVAENSIRLGKAMSVR